MRQSRKPHWFEELECWVRRKSKAAGGDVLSFSADRRVAPRLPVLLAGYSEMMQTHTDQTLDTLCLSHGGAQNHIWCTLMKTEIAFRRMSAHRLGLMLQRTPHWRRTPPPSPSDMSISRYDAVWCTSEAPAVSHRSCLKETLPAAGGVQRSHRVELQGFSLTTSCLPQAHTEAGRAPETAVGCISAQLSHSQRLLH